jgi:hypothetical protein
MKRLVPTVISVLVLAVASSASAAPRSSATCVFADNDSFTYTVTVTWKGADPRTFVFYGGGTPHFRFPTEAEQRANEAVFGFLPNVTVVELFGNKDRLISTAEIVC